MPFHNNRMTDLLCYGSRTFSIFCNGKTLDVFREKDKQLIDSVEIDGKDRDSSYWIFHFLKENYIYDYDNVLQ